MTARKRAESHEGQGPVTGSGPVATLREHDWKLRLTCAIRPLVMRRVPRPAVRGVTAQNAFHLIF
jgi:hypothetical protein